MFRLFQTRSGRQNVNCSTGSSRSPGDATTLHITPDQNQYFKRAAFHTNVCTVLACLETTPIIPEACELLAQRQPGRGGLGISW